ncbi:MAG: glycosyltransferase family 25 protein [Bacteroidota bacterium]
MKIFVINLKRSVERRVKIEKQLKSLGMDYEIFEGVDGYKLTEDDLNKYMDHEHKYFRELKKGEIGCFLSHYSVLKKIVDLELPSAIVMEDDIILSKNFPTLVIEIEKFIQPSDTFLFYTILLQPVNLFTKKKINDKYTLTDVDNIRSLFGMQCYAVGSETAKQISSHLLPVNNVVDDWLRYVENGYTKNLQIIFPFPIKATPAFSDIHDTDISNTRFAWFKTLIRKHKIFPFWQIIMYKRKKWSEHGTELISVDGKQVPSKFL